MEESLQNAHSDICALEDPYYPKISIVIPARNEAANLCHVLPHIPVSVAEVILVDGHSTDDTIIEAQRLLPSIRILRQEGRGKGDALRTGFHACRGDIIVMLDADGSADPSEIPRFVEVLIEGNDFAKGSRFLAGGGSEDITSLRRWGNAFLSKCVNLLFKTHFSDLCYGYNAFWKRCLDQVAIDCDGFEVETMLNLRMHMAKMKIVEIPSFEHMRIYGQSNLRVFRDGWRVLHTILHEHICAQIVKVREMPGHRKEATPIISRRLFLSFGRLAISIDISIKKRTV